MLDVSANSIHSPTSIGQLLLVTRGIVKHNQPLLIENKQNRPIMVSINEAHKFNLGMELINDLQYSILVSYYHDYGNIAVIEKLIDFVRDKQRLM